MRSTTTVRAGFVIVLVACRATSTQTPIPHEHACGAGVPAAACNMFRAIDSEAPLTTCDARAPSRIGEWRYALVAPLYSPIEDITSEELAGLWRGDKRTLEVGRDTRDALTVRFGATRAEPSERITVGVKRWAIVPADDLVPLWKVITVDGKHPLTEDTATKNFRPVVPRNAAPELRVLWMRGTYGGLTVWDTATWGAGVSAGGVTDHGDLTGLADDDHTQKGDTPGMKSVHEANAEGVNPD